MKKEILINKDKQKYCKVNVHIKSIIETEIKHIHLNQKRNIGQSKRQQQHKTKEI